MTEHQPTNREATEGELFRLLVENVKDYAIFVMDPEGRVRSWNPGAERLLGYSEDDIIGQPAALFFTQEDIESGVPQGEMRKAVERGREEDARWHVRKDGSRFWSAGTITPLWDEGRKLRGFAKIMRDHTSQKRSDNALKDALAYSEGVVETVRESLLILGADLRVKTANRSFYQTFRVSPGETEARLIYDLGDHQWDIPLLRKLLEEILPQNTSFDGFEVEHEFGAIGHKVMLLNARRFAQEGNQTELILLAIEDITERRRAEDERREIETRFTSLVKHVKAHSILTMDPEGRISSWNEEAECILGYAEAEILGQPYSIIFTPEDLQNGLPENELRRATARGFAEDERWHVRKGGERFWALGIVTPTHDASGAHTGFSKILRDMTERKQAEKKLQQAHAMAKSEVRERTAQLQTANEDLQAEMVARRDTEKAVHWSEAHKATVLDVSLDAIITIDHEGKVVEFNPAAESIFGYARAEIVGKELAEMVLPPHLREKHRRGLANYLATGEATVLGKRLELSALRSDASEFPIELTIVRIPGAGQPMFTGFIRDLTERKQAEEDLRASEDRYRRIIETTSDGVWTLDAEFRTNFVNRRMAEMLGYTVDEMMGQSLFEFMDGEGERTATASLERRGKGGAEQLDFKFRRKNGSDLWTIVSTAAILEDGRYAGALAIITDISERKILEQQFQQAQKMEAFGQLAGGVAHDFNNLLTIISGYSEILLGSLRPDDRHRGLIEQIHKAGERATLLTRQLLAFSRKQVVQPQVLDLNALVAGTEKMLGRLIGEDVILTTVLRPGLGRVKADPGQVEQVIMNLVVNARDAMPQGGRITIESANVDLDEYYGQSHAEVMPGRYVLLAVSDTGSGMTEEVQRRIFEPFFTTKEVGKGTGLGLATVFGIARQSGGHVRVYSEVGHGTTFKIYLPSVDEVASPLRKEMRPALVLTGTETILLVEDEDALRRMIGLTLQTMGYTVLDAGDTDDAIRICEQRQGAIHLLVSDVVMPKMGGRQLAERLTALHPEMRVLFVSGYTDDAVVRHGVLQAEVSFLQKPFSMDSLHQKVRAVLAGPH